MKIYPFIGTERLVDCLYSASDKVDPICGIIFYDNNLNYTTGMVGLPFYDTP